MEPIHFSPAEISHRFIETGCKKANLPKGKIFLLGILAGAFIAFASAGSNVAIHTIESVGLAKVLAGAIFSTGLMMVVITGAELFTGNALIVVSCLERQARWRMLLKNWLFVYTGNFVGALIIAAMIILSGQLNFSGGMLGGFTIKTAAYKVGLSFSNAFFMGVMCNWLVCMAVWMSSATKDITGKLVAIFFPIWLFIISGFEHSIANMYYIPAGIIAASDPAYVNAAASLGVSSEMLSGLNWGSFLLKNLLPVTLGNIVGGTVFVGAAYWLAHLYRAGKNKKAQQQKSVAKEPDSDNKRM